LNIGIWNLLRISNFEFRIFRRFHHNTQGAISVLVLLTIWCLVAMIAMIWNQVEYAQKKQTLQCAADSAAHSAMLWTSRAANQIAAQNTIICQDAAAETIWLAIVSKDYGVNPNPGVSVQPDGTYMDQGSSGQGSSGRGNRRPNTSRQGHDIKSELAGELVEANLMLDGLNANPLQRRIQNAINNIAIEKGFLDGAISDLAGNLKEGNYPDAQSATDFQKQLRQLISAEGWVDSTYLNGGQPGNGRPGGPGPGGEGLLQIAQDKMTKQDPNILVLELIINYINTVELPIIQGPDNAAPDGRSFETRTGPVVNQAVDAQVQNHEIKVYADQKAVLDGVALAVEDQRSQLAALYKADITLANPMNKQGDQGSAQITAPVQQGDQVDTTLGQGYTDSIRAQFPAEAAAAGLPLTFDIDPLNPQTENPVFGDARVWHPPLPSGIVPDTARTYNVICDAPGGWGHVWCFPLERYYNQRVWNDQQTLCTTYMQYLDDSRNNRPNNPRDLAWQIREILGLNSGPQPPIAPLPGSIPDDQPDDKGAIEQINVLPSLTAPPTATAKFRTQVMLCNQHSGKYIAAVNALRALLINDATLYLRFTDSFAVDCWSSAVAYARDEVLQDLGTSAWQDQGRGFMVLATYKLRYIPEELKGGMNDSAVLAIQDQINVRNIGSTGYPGNVTRAIIRDLINIDPDGVVKPMGRQYAYSYYSPRAITLAFQVVPPIAHQAAINIAREWLNRPWPYEITPTTEPVPPWRGLTKGDRQEFFTLLAAAKQSDGTTPRFLIPAIFQSPPTLATYAQAETLNWNEYNTNYGGSERYDEVSVLPYQDTPGYSVLRYVPVPRCWRLSTVGGWAWQPRLAISDAIGQTIQNNPEFQSYMNTAGITGGQQSDFDTVGLH